MNARITIEYMFHLQNFINRAKELVAAPDNSYVLPICTLKDNDLSHAHLMIPTSFGYA